MENINYLTHKGVCLTSCKYMEGIAVGSFLCDKCRYKHEKNYDLGIVTCKYKDYCILKENKRNKHKLIKKLVFIIIVLSIYVCFCYINISYKIFDIDYFVICSSIIMFFTGLFVSELLDE